MTRYQCDLARPSDDVALRRLMATTPMPGSVTLTFHREPNYFGSDCVLGPRRQTVIIRDRKADTVVGIATRSARPMYVAGKKQLVGYLGGLRIAKCARGRGLLARGFRFLRDLHEADSSRPAYYLTTIAEGNTMALEPLTSGRAGLPTYHPLCRLHTLVLPLEKRKATARESWSTDCHVEPLSDWDELLGFFQEHGSKRTFFPDYQRCDFGDGGYHASEPTFRGLQASSTLVARRNGIIVGAAGLWDQRSFRQSVVQQYSRSITAFRPALNLWSRWTAGVQLPAPGEKLQGCYVSFPVIAGDDPNVLRSLLHSLMQIAPATAQFMLIGFCDGDPLLPVAQSLARSTYTTRLYAVAWDPLPPSITETTSHRCYLELGCL